MFGFKNSKNVLVADIGGTNVNFAVLDNKFNIVFKKEYKTIEVKNFTELVKNLLTELKQFNIFDACFAFAGPINRERTEGKGTNISWNINIDEIRIKTRLKKIFLINDFEAIGFAIDIMKPEQYSEITSYGRNSKGTLAIIGSGTGLGVGICADIGNRHLPIQSEGGHVNIHFDMTNPLEKKLHDFLKKRKFPDEYESLLSGGGILTMYEFLLGQKLKHNKKIENNIKRAHESERPALISNAAINEKDILCMKVMDLFIRFYAKAARNLALTSLCSELIIAGGIPPRILTRFQEGFFENFVEHDVKNFRNILERTTILVITDYNISLYGAANALNYSM